MYTERVRLVNFRNHRDSVFSFKKLNYIEGDNGSGKTSVIEAVYLLFCLKSFRPQTVNRAVSFETPFLQISAKCIDIDYPKTIHYKYDSSATLRDESGKISDKTNYLLDNPVICYSPEYRQIISDDQDDRRRFLDRIAFQLDIAHFDRLTDLKKLNRMKIIELKKHDCDMAYIDSLNDRITDISKKITGARQCAVMQINERLRELYASLNVQDFYQLDLRTNSFRPEILKKEKEDKRQVYGSSRDKLYCMSENRIYDRFSSFGQKKTFVLLSLAAGLKVLEQNGRNGIITMLDDFEAGLDLRRVKGIFQMFLSSSQIFITGVKNSNFPDLNTIRLQVKDVEHSQ